MDIVLQALHQIIGDDHDLLLGGLAMAKQL